jgi:hypothetical protein
LPRGHWRKLIDSADETWRGSGSSLASELQADHESLSLLARSFALFVRDKTETAVSESRS